ncbi:MAG TPA: TlpA disulfide reductase family protein [Burkholderiaceae bacterium]|nr:TlpA disulfide reductase family protein [Burkholderiaceae bacterium]
MDRRQLLVAAACGAAAAARAQAPLGDAAAAEAKASPLPAVGAPLVLAPIERLDSTRFDPRSADGRVLVVYWWASWCPFCAETTPQMDALWRAQAPLGSKGLLLLALSIDNDPKPARDYLARRGYTLPAAWVTPAFARAVPKPRGLPVTVVRGRDGRVLQAEAGQLFPEDVQALARHL